MIACEFRDVRDEKLVGVGKRVLPIAPERGDTMSFEGEEYVVMSRAFSVEKAAPTKLVVWLRKR